MFVEPKYHEYDLINSLPDFDEVETLISKMQGSEKKINFDYNSQKREIVVKTVSPHPTEEFNRFYHLLGPDFKCDIEICHWPMLEFYNKDWDAIEHFIQKDELRRLPIYHQALKEFIDSSGVLKALSLQPSPHIRYKKRGQRPLLGLDFEENKSPIGAVNIWGNEQIIELLGKWISPESEVKEEKKIAINVQPHLQLASFQVLVSELKTYEVGDVIVAPALIQGECIEVTLNFGKCTYQMSLNLNNSNMEVNTLKINQDDPTLPNKRSSYTSATEAVERGEIFEAKANPAPATSEVFDVGALAVPVSFELDEIPLKINELESLSEGQVIELGHLENPIITIKCNRKSIGQGRLVKFKNKIGVELLRIESV